MEKEFDKIDFTNIIANIKEEFILDKEKKMEKKLQKKFDKIDFNKEIEQHGALFDSSQVYDEVYDENSAVENEVLILIKLHTMQWYTSISIEL